MRLPSIIRTQNMTWTMKLLAHKQLISCVISEIFAMILGHRKINHAVQLIKELV